MTLLQQCYSHIQTGLQALLTIDETCTTLSFLPTELYNFKVRPTTRKRRKCTLKSQSDRNFRGDNFAIREAMKVLGRLISNLPTHQKSAQLGMQHLRSGPPWQHVTYFSYLCARCSSLISLFANITSNVRRLVRQAR